MTDTTTLPPITVEGALAFCEQQVDKINRSIKALAEGPESDDPAVDAVVLMSLAGASAAYMHTHAFLSGEPVNGTGDLDTDSLVRGHLDRTFPDEG